MAHTEEYEQSTSSLSDRSSISSGPSSEFEDIAHTNDQAKYICSCGNNPAANKCTCSECYQASHRAMSPCGYFGRCIEPLAWSLEGGEIMAQSHSPLFTRLPKELRDMVFEHALTDNRPTSLQDPMQRYSARVDMFLSHGIALNLLRTCRAVYLETWSWPLMLNPYIIDDLGRSDGMERKCFKLLPWQVALVQGLDITLQQIALEGSLLRDYLLYRESWRPKERHAGVYVAPSRYKVNGEPLSLVDFDFVKSFNCSLIAVVNEGQEQDFLSMTLGTRLRYNSFAIPPWPSNMRVIKARPLIHLTLRLPYDNWWTWAAHPNVANSDAHLGLDPTVGDGSAEVESRPTSSRMRALAEQRRAGQPPEIDSWQGWAGTIGQLPDLKTLELVLETFKAKQRQLDNVVEAAKTWRFPNDDRRFELVWNGEVENRSWKLPDSHNRVRWHDVTDEFEVRVVRYVRRLAA